MKQITTLLLAALFASCAAGNSADNKINYVEDIPTFDTKGNLQAVVEIPAGSCQKWEVNKDSGVIEWERINPDSMRVVNYLPYPANYGFIPKTLMDKSKGGDGDPVDLFILGDGAERGDVIPCHVVGVITMLDHKEQDDKLIALSLDSHFADIKSLDELQTKYPGIVEILTTWLRSYKRDGGVEIAGVTPISDINDYLNQYKR